MNLPVMLSLPYRRWSVWLALLVAVFTATAPTVSRAYAAGQSGSGPSIEICTAQGSRWVAPNATTPLEDSSSSEQGSTPSVSHCPFCLLSADRCAPPPSAVVNRVLLQVVLTVALVRQDVHCLVRPYGSASPRGPPAF
jgi:putative Ca2+/H+ antiporter (TMEM165/GDT1 family)